MNEHLLTYLNVTVDGFPPLDPENREWDDTIGRSINVLCWMNEMGSNSRVPVIARYLYETEKWRVAGYDYPSKSITQYAIFAEPK